MTSFTDFGLAKPILQALADAGYETPTPIQAEAIPPLMEGRDLLGAAQTGTGKTAAFALPILHRLQADLRRTEPGRCRALILSPTRELAAQIAESFRTYGKHMGFVVAAIFGGMKYGPQIKAISRGVDILVATPGRLIDHITEGHLDLSTTEVFVLDEADQMLDLGFLKPIRQIASRLPKERQNLFFSATMPDEAASLASDMLNEPVRVQVAPVNSTTERVEQTVIFVEGAKKRAMLTELFADDSLERVLVFAKTKFGAERVAGYLETGGVMAAAIHGDKNQSQRDRALVAFKMGKVRALVATDIAARGIDVSGVTHVVNFDLPMNAEAYVHRIGRTGRGGAEGKAITLCGDDERRKLRDVQRLIKKTLFSIDRRRDKALSDLDASIQAAGLKTKPSALPPLEQPRRHLGQDDRNKGGRGRRGDRFEGRGERFGRGRFERDGVEAAERRHSFEAEGEAASPWGEYADGGEEAEAPRRERREGGFRERREGGFRGERREGGFRGRGERSEGGFRGERGERPEGGFRPRGERPEGGFRGREDRAEGGFRGERGERPEGGFRSRGERSEGGFRGRGERSEGGFRGERGDRPNFKSRDRAPGWSPMDTEFGGEQRKGLSPEERRSFARERNGERGERGGDRGGFRSREDRPQGDRPFNRDRAERPHHDRAERGFGGERREGGFRSRDERGHGDRPFGRDRNDRPHHDRGERSERGERSDRGGNRSFGKPAFAKGPRSDRGEVKGNTDAGSKFARRPKRG